MADYEQLRPELTLAAPANEDTVAGLRDELGRQMPDDYLAFLAAHDGAEGAIGEIAPAADVGRGADVCPEVDHLRDFVVFGSNGGGEVFAFDSDGRAVVVPWIGGIEDAVPQGTFTDFLSRLVEGRLFERDP
jgi:hypothetical protein